MSELNDAFATILHHARKRMRERMHGYLDGLSDRELSQLELPFLELIIETREKRFRMMARRWYVRTAGGR